MSEQQERRFPSRGQVLQTIDTSYEEIFVPYNWNFWVCLRTLPSIERDAFEVSVAGRLVNGARQQPNLANMRARLVAMCWVDYETKERMFVKPEDVAALGNKDAMAMDFLFDHCKRINGIGADTTKELEKNSEATDGELEPIELPTS